MTLAAGTRLGSYEILDLVGVGGMGEVYRARDTNLKREVAIKILPDSLAAEPERISRFVREAETLASLNHSNIAIVHDFQQAEQRHFLVMEFVPGETLADRLRRGPVPLDEGLQIARQIAEALEAAHQRGIIHRDLKPANIKVDTDGKIKVLDFGLAKILTDAGDALDVSNSPTLMSRTAGGVILGTAAYMSPEQARGRTVDKRTDIWALGCVLFETLTGQQAFAGDNISDTIAAVIRSEPDWSTLPAETPGRIRTLIARCLRKDPRQRLHDAADVRIEIDDASAAGEAVAAGQPARTNRVLPIAIALAAGVVIASAFWWLRTRAAVEAPLPVHLTLPLTKDTLPVGGQTDNPFVISPDGNWVVYVAGPNDRRQLYLRAIHEDTVRVVAGSEGASNPFFSFDSRWIGFGSGKELKKVPVSGGSPTTICNCLAVFEAGVWDSDNRIFFVPAWNVGIWTVPADGGTAQLLLNTDAARDMVAFDDLEVLPDRRGILMTIASGQTLSADDAKIAVLEPGGKEPRILIQGGYHAKYLSTGHLVYGRGGALLTVPFDLSRLAVTGTPVPVVEGVEKAMWDPPRFSVSQNGTLIYEPATGIESGGRFAIVDRRGNLQPITERRGNIGEFSLSRDGKHIAARLVAVNDDIWTFDLATGTPNRFTAEPFDEIFPEWTPDGSRIVFGTRTGSLFSKRADGSGPREELSRGEYQRMPGSFSPDGKTLAFVEVHPLGQGDIWLLSLDGDRKASAFIATEANERTPKFSPDGRWLAYSSDETGRNEIYVRMIGSAGAKKRVSTDGGNWPAWSPKKDELFFLKGDKIAAVTLDAQGSPVGRDHIVLEVPPKLGDLVLQNGNGSFDVMPDGDHFVVALKPNYPSPTHYNIVVNWMEELKRKVQPGK